MNNKTKVWAIPERYCQRTVAAVISVFLISLVLVVACAPQKAMPAAIVAADLNSHQLYDLTNVWTIQVRISPDQWEAMEPKGGINPFAVFGGGPPGGSGVLMVQAALAWPCFSHPAS